MKKRVRVALLLFLLLSLLIFFNNKLPPISYSGGVVQNIFSSPKAFLYKLKVGLPDLPAGFLNNGSEVSRLKEENKRLVAKLVDYEALKKDNEALKSQFDSGLTGVENSEVRAAVLLPARVVGLSGSFGRPHALVVDRGERDGVRGGMAVVFGKNLIGKIKAAGPNFSQVILPTNKIFSTLGNTLSNNAVGIVKGEEDFLLFDRVVITEMLTDGDIVVTKGEVRNNDIEIPAGLIVGKISSINRRQTSPFQSAKISPIVDYSKFDMVFVMKEL